MKRADKLRNGLALVVVALAGTVALAGCGSTNGSENSAGNGTDLAFVDAMVPHHEMAIDMAKIAKERGEHPEIKQLADDIVSSQQGEVARMNLIRDDLSDLKKTPLGLPAHLAGMDMKSTTLRTAKPFDREFIDMMIPHHQGAIRMARVEETKGKSPALKMIAADMIEAQSKEIREMNDWRTTWYGKPSPAGGVPAASGGGETHQAM
jgi:uncharacterized protein (DUF305 family)